MLGRAADHLYWMARYLERAENNTRLLRTCHLVDLLPPEHLGNDKKGVWHIPMLCTGTMAHFDETYEEVTRDRVLAFMISDMANAASLRCCFHDARENARATRPLLTTDIWECINQTWLAISGLTGRVLRKENIGDRMDWMIDRCYMFQGTFQGSMRRGEERLFALMGQTLERAGHTCRYLTTFAEAMQSGLRRDFSPTTSAHQSRHLYITTLMLRGLNSYKAYRELYSANVTFEGTAELLVLEPTVPRSVRCCVDELATTLRTLNPDCEALRQIYDLQYRLQTVEMNHLRRIGLSAFLRDTVKHLDRLSLQIQHDFMMIQ